jgi:hypothetical protein
MNFRKVDRGDMDEILLAQDRGHCKALLNTVLDLRVP